MPQRYGSRGFTALDSFMNIIITGGSGQIASEIAAHIKNAISFSKHDLDITNVTQIRHRLIPLLPAIVINCAAYTAVDKAEQEVDLAYRINRDGAAALSTFCLEHNAMLIHLSTDYVFDGHKLEPYTELDQPNPLSHYGKSKWEGEDSIRRILPQHLILRVSGVFGFHGNNFVKTMLRLAQEKDALQVVSDQITCPTPAADIAEVIAACVTSILKGQHSWGTYHYCSTPPVSWYDFARSLLEEARRYIPIKTKTIAPILSADWHSPAIRPKNAVLNCDKIRKVFQISQKPWKIQLQTVIKRLLQNESVCS